MLEIATVLLIPKLASTAPPGLSEDEFLFESIIHSTDSTWEKRVIAALLTLSLVSHIEVGFFEKVLSELKLGKNKILSLGLIEGRDFPGLLPTVGTFLYLLGGNDTTKRLELLNYCDKDSILVESGIITLRKPENNEPFIASRLDIAPEYVDLFLRGYSAPPKLSPSFPAQLLQTDLEWKDLVLPSEVRTKINHLKKWLQHHSSLQELNVLSRHLKRGFMTLFSGPPGTGKTLTASLLGKVPSDSGEVLTRLVYRIDLSMVVSKFVGETEKNLSKIFDRAKHQDWILLFDEADALFGKRTQVRDAHDRYANQQIAYLLQRIEEYPGLVVLTSNLSANIDPAFYRRFDMILQFPIPGPKERLTIWQKALELGKYAEGVQVANDVDKKYLANTYKISGAAIINAIKYAVIESFGNKNQNIVQQDLLIEGIKQELRKEGLVV